MVLKDKLSGRVILPSWDLIFSLHRDALGFESIPLKRKYTASKEEEYAPLARFFNDDMFLFLKGDIQDPRASLVKRMWVTLSPCFSYRPYSFPLRKMLSNPRTSLLRGKLGLFMRPHIYISSPFHYISIKLQNVAKKIFLVNYWVVSMQCFSIPILDLDYQRCT